MGRIHGTGKSLGKGSRKKPPKGTKRNPWYRIRTNNKVRYCRVTEYGMWLVTPGKLPKDAIVSSRRPRREQI